MHYYPHHIGDYQRDTATLSVTEHGAYRLLMDAYYASEKPLPADQQALCRICRAMSKAEREAVAVVVTAFFQTCDEGLRHKRIDAEIAAYQASAEVNRQNGKKGGRPPKRETQQKPNGFSAGSVSLTQRQTQTITETKANQDPRSKNNTFAENSAGGGEENKPEKPKPPPDPRHAPFRKAFVDEFREHTGQDYPFQQKDAVQLADLLRKSKNLTLDEFVAALRWCRQIAQSDTYANNCVRMTGNLAAFCSAWGQIVEYHANYSPKAARR